MEVDFRFGSYNFRLIATLPPLPPLLYNAMNIAALPSTPSLTSTPSPLTAFELFSKANVKRRTIFIVNTQHRHSSSLIVSPIDAFNQPHQHVERNLNFRAKDNTNQKQDNHTPIQIPIPIQYHSRSQATFTGER